MACCRDTNSYDWWAKLPYGKPFSAYQMSIAYLEFLLVQVCLISQNKLCKKF